MGVYVFDDFDEMFRALSEDMAEADNRVKPWQTKIMPGEYFMRRTEMGFSIYGEILKEDETRPEALENYRLCRAYSVACPLGELGDVHVSTIESLLSKDEFEEARKYGWQRGGAS